MEKESDLNKQLVEYFKLVSIFYLRMNTQGIKHKVRGKSFTKKNPNKGMADFFVKVNSRTLWVESKSDKGEAREAQLIFRDKVQAEGDYYLKTRSLETVIYAVHALRQLPPIELICLPKI